VRCNRMSIFSIEKKYVVIEKKVVVRHMQTEIWLCVVCSHILDTPVTEREFLEQLHELNHKINFVKEQSFRDARACHDVKDILEKLKIKVCAKLRFICNFAYWLLMFKHRMIVINMQSLLKVHFRYITQ
jgi:hypothetical protein